jgi:hypothetical protein
VNFPGQVVERGGEFIDNLHKTLLGYAQELDLPLEDVEKQPGEVTYYFNGRHYPESAVVEEYRRLVAAMQADLRAISGSPTADTHTDADVALDRRNLREYLETRGAGPVIKAAVIAAYSRIRTGPGGAELPELPAVHPRRQAVEVPPIRRFQRRALPRDRRQRRDPPGAGRAARRPHPARDAAGARAQDRRRGDRVDLQERLEDRHPDA